MLLSGKWVISLNLTEKWPDTRFEYRNRHNNDYQKVNGTQRKEAEASSPSLDRYQLRGVMIHRMQLQVNFLELLLGRVNPFPC
jgi:hypothetical protein